MFGGQSHYSGLPQDIARLKESSLRWNKVGEIMSSRHGHSVIQLGQSFLVVGGKGRKRTEVCDWSHEILYCNEQNPILADYDLYPELFVVPDNYCKFN